MEMEHKNDITQRIQAALQTIAAEEQLYILYACESGSRAWEFASHDSDYDVRFLYVRPREAYLKLDLPRDVIERPIVDDLDINGWDIFKALRLLRKSNPPLLEWLFSPLVYAEYSPSIEELRVVIQQHYSSTATFYHYSSMAYRNYHQYIEQKAQVPLKKYLYVLRPIIALLYLEQKQAIPPTSFLTTLASVDISQDVRTRIENLVARKKAGDELGQGSPDLVLNALIDEHLTRWNKPFIEPHDQQNLTQILDAILSKILAEGDSK
jgi:uncharacterized protein